MNGCHGSDRCFSVPSSDLPFASDETHKLPWGGITPFLSSLLVHATCDSVLASQNTASPGLEMCSRGSDLGQIKGRIQRIQRQRERFTLWLFSCDSMRLVSPGDALRKRPALE